MVTNTPPPVDTVIFRQDWRLQLAQENEAVAARLLSAYQRVANPLRDMASDVAIDMARLAADSQKITASDLQGLKSWQRLLLRVETEMQDFGVILRNETGLAQESGIQLGLDAAADMVGSSAGPLEGAVMTVFNRPDPADLQQLMGYVDGDAMRQRFARFGPDAAQNLADTMLSFVAQGKNPVTTARVLSNWFAVPYTWAENTTRTVQNWSYRSASHAAYAANPDIVTGWVWWASLDDRTCLSCWAQHGTVHDVREVLNDHHRGRCTPLPVVRGTKWADNLEAGPEVFARLDRETQARIMPASYRRALDSGAITWGDMSRPYTNDVYGEMLRQASLKDMLGGGARRFYSTPPGPGRGPSSPSLTPTAGGQIPTVNGLKPRDIGSPGRTLQSLERFIENSHGPLADAMTDIDMNMIGFDANANFAINRANVSDAAKKFVRESQDIQYGKDYMVSLVVDQARRNGVNVSGLDGEKLYNDYMANRAQAIRTLAGIGNVRLTEAQQRRLQTAERGGWLDMVYTTESSKRGSLANRAMPNRGRSGGLTGAERRQARENFQEWVLGIDRGRR